MTLDEALHYIHSVCWKGSVPGLERISALLDKMGHPERKLKFIHVTGTNGCLLYTSPSPRDRG